MEIETSPRRRLDSWKAIAQHFDRSSRTVQRWHTEYQLPVHRLGGDRGSVFAYAEELDQWISNRRRSLAVDPTALPTPVRRGSPPRVGKAFDLNESGDSSLISATDRARSDDAVALAFKMWETLSHRNLHAITRLFREGIELNPTNAMAFAGLCHALIVSASWGLMSASSAYASAEAALRRAHEIDAELAEVKCAEAWLKLHSRRDWNGAARDFDQLLGQPPVSKRVLLGRAITHLALGNLNQALDLVKDAMQLDALCFSPRALQCWITYLKGEFALALEQIHDMRAAGLVLPAVDAIEALACTQLEPPDAQIERIQALVAHTPRQNVLCGALGYAYAVANERQKATKILHELQQQKEKVGKHASYAIALVLIGQQQSQEAIPYIEQSYQEGSRWSLGFRSDPILAPLRIHPEFQQFLSRSAYSATEDISSRPIPIRNSELWTANSRATA